MKKLLALAPFFLFALPVGCMKKAPENAAPAAAPAATAAPASAAPVAMPACCTMEKGVHTCQHGTGGPCCAGHATK